MVVIDRNGHKKGSAGSQTFGRTYMFADHRFLTLEHTFIAPHGFRDKPITTTSTLLIPLPSLDAANSEDLLPTSLYTYSSNVCRSASLTLEMFSDAATSLNRLWSMHDRRGFLLPIE